MMARIKAMAFTLIMLLGYVAAKVLCLIGIHNMIQTGWAQSHGLLYRVPTWKCWRCPKESMGWR